MNHLHRELAPISDAAWAEIEEEASRTLRHFLAARALVDFEGPRGWRHAAEPVGTVTPLASGPAEGVRGGVRAVQPMVELRTVFEVSRAELESIDRGAFAPDLDAVTEAAKRAAAAEDTAVFYGYAAGGITGLVEASPHDPIRISDDYEEYPSSVAKAVSKLMAAGVEGPYGIALGPRCYRGVIETTQHGGYPVFDHVRRILGGPLIWAPAVSGAVVVSTRGGDASLVCGQDFSIGYLDHDAESVRLYLEESLTLLVRDDRAAIGMVYEG